MKTGSKIHHRDIRDVLSGGTGQVGKTAAFFRGVLSMQGNYRNSQDDQSTEQVFNDKERHWRAGDDKLQEESRCEAGRVSPSVLLMRVAQRMVLAFPVQGRWRSGRERGR